MCEQHLFGNNNVDFWKRTWVLYDDYFASHCHSLFSWLTAVSIPSPEPWTVVFVFVLLQWFFTAADCCFYCFPLCCRCLLLKLLLHVFSHISHTTATGTDSCFVLLWWDVLYKIQLKFLVMQFVERMPDAC